MLVLARGEERPAMRAAMGKWRYTYGVYDPGVPPEAGQILRWTERHGVAVVSNDAPWMILTVRAQHPDLLERPVKARVEVNGRVVVDRTLHTDAPITRVINTGSADRAIIETRVDRTWRPPDVPARSPDVGLSLSWRFSTEKPAAPAAVTAMLTGQVEDARRRALTVESVTVSPAGPVVAGTPVEWTATARGGTAPLQYQFWLSDGSTWTLLQDWGANAKAPWTPTAAGSYSVQVWVHSAGSPAAREAFENSATLVVTPDPERD